MDLLPYITSESSINLFIIIILYLVTWVKSLKGGFCIDDDMGIQQFTERYIDGKIVDGDADGKWLKYNPKLGFPGAFMRWHRLNIGKKFTVIGKNEKGHEIYGYIQSAFRHHLWSLFVGAVSCVLCYNFLDFHFGSSIAFPATVLFSVHPIACQSIAWISGINYLYCLMFLLANYNFLQLDLSYWWTIPVTAICTLLSSLSLLVGCFNFVILFTLGYKWQALIALIVAIYVMVRDGKTVVSFRRNEFKKQNMTNSITPNIRKPIVMVKTLWYYICLVTVPKSLGLYHEFGYHYGRKDEEPDHMFWCGLLSLFAMGVAFFMGGLLAKLCVIWFLAYWIIFSNILTANQFVVDRYIHIPSLAYCVFFAWLVYPFPTLFWFLIGLYMMRSIMHIWTFKDHVSFYSSNIMNFPKSEVAYGNLGVAYQGLGKSGTAFDLWSEATKINPLYDVPWYNMHSLVKSAGQLEQARDYLKNCMNAKIVHFKETWDREMAALDNEILKKKVFDALNRELNDAVNSGKIELIKPIKEKLDALMKPGTTVQMAQPPVQQGS